MDFPVWLGLGLLTAGIVKLVDFVADFPRLWRIGAKGTPVSHFLICAGLVGLGIFLITPTVITPENAPWFMIGLFGIVWIVFGADMILKYQQGIKRWHRTYILRIYGFRSEHKHWCALIVSGGMCVVLCLLVIIYGIFTKASAVAIGGTCFLIVLLSLALYVLAEVVGYVMTRLERVRDKRRIERVLNLTEPRSEKR